MEIRPTDESGYVMAMMRMTVEKKIIRSKCWCRNRLIVVLCGGGELREAFTSIKTMEMKDEVGGSFTRRQWCEKEILQ